MFCASIGCGRRLFLGFLLFRCFVLFVGLCVGLFCVVGGIVGFCRRRVCGFLFGFG